MILLLSPKHGLLYQVGQRKVNEKNGGRNLKSRNGMDPTRMTMIMMFRNIAQNMDGM
jgi:hypothetical protein